MFLERQNELEQVFSACRRSANGHGNIVLIAGEAGIGKTTLLEAARNELTLAHQVYWSACDPFLTPRPFGPLHDFAAEFASPVLPLLRNGALPTELFSTFYRTLETTKHPRVLVIEDAHWADHGTLDLIKYLGRRIAFSACTLVISYRDDEVSEADPLSSVLAALPSGHTNRVILTPLSQTSVEQMASAAGKSIKNLHQITSGNPFFVSEMLASELPSTDTVPASVQEAVNARIFRLVEKERRFLETMSLIPKALTTELLQVLFDEEGETLALACVARKLLVVDSRGHFRFRHELARLGTQTRLPVNQQKGIHQRILRALQTLNTDDLGLLVHHAAGSLDGNAVLQYAPLAAQRAATIGAHREAASYLTTALKFIDEAPTELAAQLYQDWAYEAGISLQIDDAVVQARRNAISLWRALGRNDKIGENLRWLSRLHWYRGEANEARHFADEAIKIYEALPESSDRAMAYSFRSQLDMLNGRMQDAIHFGQRALALETKYPQIEVRVHALNNVGSALVLRGDHSGEPLLQESLELALKQGFHEHAARVYTNMSDYLVRFKKLEKAEQWLTDGIAYDTKFDLDSWTYYLVGIQAQLRLAQGRLEDAATIGRGVLALNQLTLLMQLPALCVVAKAESRMGKPDVDHLLGLALKNAMATNEQQYIIPARLNLIENAWLHEMNSVAYEQLQILCAADPDHYDFWVAGEIAVWLQRFNFSIPYNTTHQFALPHQLECQRDYTAAAQSWMELGMPFEAALCFLVSDLSQQTSHLQTAHSMLDKLGAKAYTERARSIASTIGALKLLPKRRRGPNPNTRQHPLGLTKKEQQILALLADGVTNQEIAERLSRSKRTVENHVSSVLAKMGVKNRVDAMLRVQSEPWLLPPKSH